MSSPDDENKRLKSHVISQNYFIEQCRKQIANYIPEIGPNGDDRSLLKAISNITQLIDLLGNDLVDLQKMAEQKLEFEFNKQLVSQQQNDREKRKLKEENFKILSLLKNQRENTTKQIDKLKNQLNRQMMKCEDFRSELIEWEHYYYEQESQMEHKEYELRVREREIQKKISEVEKEKQLEIQKLQQENKLLKQRIQLIQGELKQSFEKRVIENEKNFNYQINECKLQFQIEIEELNHQIKLARQEKFELQNEIKKLKEQLRKEEITQELIDQKDEEIERLNNELVKLDIESRELNRQVQEIKQKNQTIESIEKEKNEEELNDIKDQYNKIVKEQQRRLTKQQQEYQQQMLFLQQSLKQQQKEQSFSVLTFDVGTQYEQQQQQENQSQQYSQQQQYEKQQNKSEQEGRNSISPQFITNQVGSLINEQEIEFIRSQYIIEIKLLQDQINQQNQMNNYQQDEIQKLQEEKQIMQNKLNGDKVKQEQYQNQLNQKIQQLQFENNQLFQQIQQEQNTIHQFLEEQESNLQKVNQMEDNIIQKEEQLQNNSQELIKALEIVKYLQLELENYKKINNIFKQNYDDQQLSFYPTYHKVQMGLIQKTGQDKDKYFLNKKQKKIIKNGKINDLSLNFQNLGMVSDSSDNQSNKVKKLLMNTKEYKNQKEKIFPKIMQLRNSFKVSNKPEVYSYSSRKRKIKKTQNILQEAKPQTFLAFSPKEIQFIEESENFLKKIQS